MHTSIVAWYRSLFQYSLDSHTKAVPFHRVRLKERSKALFSLITFSRKRNLGALPCSLEMSWCEQLPTIERSVVIICDSAGKPW